MSTTTRRVVSADGVSLAVHESGDPAAPTMVVIHGYPDNHHVWDAVVAALADRFHLVAYDVRGCGDSDKPSSRDAYRVERLVEDFAAVADAVSPDGPVHVLAHDWGSVQAWAAVLDENTAARIASFTSISGPGLEYFGAWLRDARSHPRAALAQVAHSYYIALFQLPRVAEMFVRSPLFDRLVSAGSGPGALDPSRTDADKVNGLWLYRANARGVLAGAVPRSTSVPVQVIVPSADAYITRELAVGAPTPWVANLTVTDVEGGHWVVSEKPDEVAALVADFVAAPDVPLKRTGKARR